ncbi:UMP-CMP kinase [Phlebotomus argentipes]|uniref:UMP-CMP kinase n=1 Tax=Phlebotomus argentipes TaxID=94469 RepID=UPI002892C5CE|nr:UMP-CMP kinase [Phlebotomus argentipes]
MLENLARIGSFLGRLAHKGHVRISQSFVAKQSDRHCHKMNLPKPNVVFVLGAPGSGKGTQCEKIMKKFDYVHLSAGDLLREERNREGSEYGELIENYIRNGKIVPVDVTCALLENAMNQNMKVSGKDCFLVDGFPRNKDNVDGWQRRMSDKVNLKFVLVFNCPEDACVERCINRGKSGSNRSDDNIDSLKKRFDTFVNDSMPIINYYKAQNLVHELDATKSPDEVFEDVKAFFADN